MPSGQPFSGSNLSTESNVDIGSGASGWDILRTRWALPKRSFVDDNCVRVVSAVYIAGFPGYLPTCFSTRTTVCRQLLEIFRDEMVSLVKHRTIVAHSTSCQFQIELPVHSRCPVFPPACIHVVPFPPRLYVKLQRVGARVSSEDAELLVERLDPADRGKVDREGLVVWLTSGFDVTQASASVLLFDVSLQKN